MNWLALERRGDLVPLFSNHGITVACEVGVRTGEHLRQWLLSQSLKRVYAVDISQPCAIACADDRVTTLTKSSVDAAAVLAKMGTQIDYVYIDADHSYESVRQDLGAWYPLVRPGGIIGGHDYTPEGVYHFGVKQAVDEFAQAQGLEVHVVGKVPPPWSDEEDVPSWFVVVPHKAVLGTFTNMPQYLPGLLGSVNKFLSQYPFRLVVHDAGIAENMERLRQEFLASGARWWVFVDHDIQFLSSDIIENAITTAEANGWALTGCNSTYDVSAMSKPYPEMRNPWSAEVSWTPGYFMLVDSSKIGHIAPETGLPGNTCIDVAYCAAIRSGGHKIGVVGETVYHTFKVGQEWPAYQEARAILKERYGEWFVDCHTTKEASKAEGTFRFHIPGLPYLATHEQYSPCAFTSKLLGLCKMLRMLGHEVLFYGAEGSQVECNEFVQVISEADRVRVYGEYDWHKNLFNAGSPDDEGFQIFNANCIREINARKQRGDFLLCQVGYFQQPIAQGIGDGLIIAEPGIGHGGIFAPYRVFESYTWMHYMYGRHNIDDGPWYDAVIPGYYDPEQFPVCYEKGDYFLFLGRIVKRKGIELAIQIAQKMGKKLIMAGQGELNSQREQLQLDPLPPGVEWVGAAGPEMRAKLMGEALAVLMPVHYIEPFGAVAVESQFCGTPIITTDWGAFPETVLHGVTGYRCRTWDDFIFAADRCLQGKIDYHNCRQWAEDNFSVHRIKYMYQEYFTKLHDLWTDPKGWYVEHPERTSLDWLNKVHPNGRSQSS